MGFKILKSSDPKGQKRGSPREVRSVVDGLRESWGKLKDDGESVFIVGCTDSIRRRADSKVDNQRLERFVSLIPGQAENEIRSLGSGQKKIVPGRE